MNTITNNRFWVVTAFTIGTLFPSSGPHGPWDCSSFLTGSLNYLSPCRYQISHQVLPFTSHSVSQLKAYLSENYPTSSYPVLPAPNILEQPNRSLLVRLRSFKNKHHPPLPQLCALLVVRCIMLSADHGPDAPLLSPCCLLLRPSHLRSQRLCEVPSASHKLLPHGSLLTLVYLPSLAASLSI